MCIFHILHSVPVVIWAAIISSILTLIGVISININNNSRLRIQLEREADERTKDRIGELRKTVYLPAVEEAAKASNALGRLPTLSLSQFTSLEFLQDHLGSLAKLQLVGSKETSILAIEYQAMFVETLFRLLAKASPIHEINNDIEIRKFHYERTQDEINRIIAKMREFNENPGRDPAIMETLRKSFDAQQTMAKKLSDEQGELFEKRNKKQLEYSIALLPEAIKIQEIATKMIVSIRKEFELDGNLGEFVEKFGELNERIKASMENLFIAMGQA